MLRLAIFTGLTLLTATVPGTAMEIPAKDWSFRALLDGSEIGFQRFALKNGADELRVASEAQLDVRFLFINAYRYRHRHEERWQDGCLQEIRANTNDNGTTYDLVGKDRGNRFVLTVNGVEQQLPACVMTFAYWNPQLVAAPQVNLLNPQDGKFVEAQVQFLGEDAVSLQGKTIPARRYRLLADELDIELWYAQDNQRWLRLESQVGSSRLVYELVN